MRSPLLGPSFPVREPWKIFASAVLAVALAAVLPRAAERPVRIAVVTDGPHEQWTDFETIFIEELSVLTESEFKVQVTQHLDGGWSAAQVKTELEGALASRDSDIMLALGFAASQQAINLKNVSKPTFAPFVTNTTLASGLDKDRTSGVKNLSYLTSEARLADQFTLYRKVVPFTRLAVLLDESLYQSIVDVGIAAKKKAAEFGIELTFVTHNGESNFVEKIPADVQAVMVAPLPRLSRNERRALVEGLIKRRLPSFSLRGDDEVEEGLLISDVSSADIRRVARQTALNIHAVLRGEPASSLPVTFERKSQVTINMATARALGISPRWEIIREAVLLNEDPTSSGAPVLLADIVKEAIQSNLRVIAGQLDTRAGQEDVAIARSVLLPQVSAQLDYSKRKADFPIVRSGLAAERTTEGSLALSQLLFSEEALANLAIQKRLHLAREAQQRGLELDVVEQASTAYLAILIAQTQLDIQQNRLRLAQANWKLAKDRVGVGKADVSDVYRWESEIATTRQRVLGAKSRLEQRRDELNALLHRSLRERFPVQPVRLEDPQFFVGRPEFLKIVDSERAFARLMVFFTDEGLRLSPEMEEIERRISAQERLLVSERLGFFMPSVSLGGRLSRVFDEQWAPNSTIRLEDENDWRVNVNLEVPVLQGGAQWARASQANYDLQQLQVQRDAVRQSIEQSIRNSMYELRASYPAIELSQKAAEAAKKTYDLVSANYIKGTRSVVDLLDAQDASLAADQTAANAVYTALTDLMALQRNVGEFDFFVDEAHLNQRMERMRTFIQHDGSDTQK